MTAAEFFLPFPETFFVRFSDEEDRTTETEGGKRPREESPNLGVGDWRRGSGIRLVLSKFDSVRQRVVNPCCVGNFGALLERKRRAAAMHK